MHASRLAWEASWKEDFDRSYVTGGLAHSFAPSIAAITPAALVAHMDNDGSIIQMQREQRSICRLQEDLVREAAARFAGDDLENKWLSTPDARRREIILEGIYKTMCLPDMENRRKWCPESTLHHLASNNGKTYIDLLKAYLPADLSVSINDPIQIPHSVMDRLLSLKPSEMNQPGMKTIIQLYKLSRAYCLSLVVWNILLAFCGINENQNPVRAPRAKGAGEILKGLGKSASKEAKEIAKQHIKLTKELHDCCSACGKHESGLNAGQKMMACKPHLMHVRECQIQDWKTGKPYPHKQVCGRLINEDVDEALKEAATKLDDQDVEDDGQIPPADPSFKRSAALLHQISLLKKHPQIDYMVRIAYTLSVISLRLMSMIAQFVKPHPKPDCGISLPNPVQRLLFNLCRTKAFETGDPDFVKQMYKMLKQAVENNPASGVKALDVRRQLEREFGITLDDII
ncbi:hypothetical protein EIP86_005855 [Pleurotus ostreatoroseus]|nr:hypothetical protein EIP86_005855 [Pleurotus ostreatoroseus]